jgi:hypothetical protein
MVFPMNRGRCYEENRVEIPPKKPSKKQGAPSDAAADSPPSPEDIAVAAYYHAERRGFAPGGELDDWLEAERELQKGSAKD